MKTRRLFSSVAATAALALPLAASAQGGGGQILSPTPCASIIYKSPTGSVQNKGPITYSWNVTNCSELTETVNVPVDTVFDSWRPDAGACTASWSWLATTLTLKPGETRGFSATMPNGTSNQCPIGTSMTLTNTASVVDTSDGSVLATTVSSIILTNRF